MYIPYQYPTRTGVNSNDMQAGTRTGTVRRDGGGRCVAELQQPDPGHVRGACAQLTRLLYRFRPMRNLGGVFRCEEGRLLAIVLQLILQLVCSSFAARF